MTWGKHVMQCVTEFLACYNHLVASSLTQNYVFMCLACRISAALPPPFPPTARVLTCRVHAIAKHDLNFCYFRSDIQISEINLFKSTVINCNSLWNIEIWSRYDITLNLRWKNRVDYPLVVPRLLQSTFLIIAVAPLPRFRLQSVVIRLLPKLRCEFKYKPDFL